MKRISFYLGSAAVVGLCLTASIARAAFLIPIASIYEFSFPDLKLLIESELTRWKQEALKYDEILYTDTLGKVGGGSLRGVSGKVNEIIAETQEMAGNGSNIIAHSGTGYRLKDVPNLGNYTQETREQIEKNLVVQAKKGIEYTTAETKKIMENQRIAINDFATSGIAMGATETVNAGVSADDSQPKKRAEQIAKAKDVGAMYELITGMDRHIYERSLHASAVEASDAGIRALQVLQGLSRTAGPLQDKQGKI